MSRAKRLGQGGNKVCNGSLGGGGQGRGRREESIHPTQEEHCKKNNSNRAGLVGWSQKLGRSERCGRLTSEIGSVRDYFIIYHYNVLEDGQGAMPSGVQPTRPFIDVLYVSWEWFDEVCFSKRIIMSRWVRAGEWRFSPRGFAVNHG